MDVDAKLVASRAILVKEEVNIVWIVGIKWRNVGFLVVVGDVDASMEKWVILYCVDA